jgi:hypothetical protein
LATHDGVGPFGYAVVALLALAAARFARQGVRPASRRP